jgi:rhodanese-related sulfurtransferase
MPPLSAPKTLFLEALVLLALSAALAVALNMARPAPLPWLGNGLPEAPAAPAPPAGTDASGEAAAPAVREVPEIDTAQALALHAAGQARFVDARFAEDFAQGHIPGALNVAPGLFEDEIRTLLGDPDPARPLVLYCSSPTCPMGQELALFLTYMGYEALSVYPGGMAEWTAAGGPAEVTR